MSEKVIGIDLGTTNSVVAVMEGGAPQVIVNSEGGRTTPSVVAFTKTEEKLVGQLAKRQSVTNPEKTFYSVKRFMGCMYEEVEGEAEKRAYKVEKKDDGTVGVRSGDKLYAPPEISAMVLQKLKQTAEDYLGTSVTKAVITVPAYFNDSQRQATKIAGKIAGLEVLRIINEPTAASLAYGLDKQEDRNIAVFDLGGGTFDVSILELGDGVFEVRSTDGDTHLGGDDFDQVLVDHFAESFQKEEGIDLRNDPTALQRLREQAEKTKCELSSAVQSDVSLPFITADQTGPKHFACTVKRSEYESMCHDLIQRLRIPCETAMREAKMTSSDIHEVILVGGMSRMPAVQELAKSIFGKEPGKSINPDEVVAMGAAIQGGILAGDVKGMVLLDVTPLSLGIETLGGVCTRLIEKNTTIPSKKSQVFSTAADNQPAVDIVVLQGEREMAKDNKRVGNFQLEGISPAPRGVPQIEVTFDIDANGTLNVSAKDKATNKEHSVRIEACGAVPDEEVERMVREAEENAEADKKQREKVETINEAESFIFSTEKSIKDLGDKVPEEEKTKVEDAIKELREALSKDDLDLIKEKKEALVQASHKIAEIAYKEEQAKSSAQGTPEGDASSAGASTEGDEPADAEVVDDDDKSRS